VLLLVLAAACSGAAPAGTPPGSTVRADASAPGTAFDLDPDPVGGTGTTVAAPVTPGAPGELIEARLVDGPAHTRAWHLTYHSRSADDRDIAVTGLLVAPEAPAADIPLVTWGHPTTGSADRCTPSEKGTQSVPLPELLTGNGMAIVATDYEGLGTTDPHPYLVGTSEGHAVLDAARAARQVTGAGVTARSPTIIWGFSQGGHAAGFAGQLAPTYAPELPVIGVAIAAPVSSVDHFARRAEDRSDQFGVLVTIVGGFAHAYPELDPGAVFTSPVVAELPELERECIGEVNIFFDRPVPDMLVAKPSERADFAARFAENELGRAPISVPVLVVQGAKDDIVDPADTQALVDRYCALGMTVAYEIKPDAKHGVLNDQPYFDWIMDRIAGDPAPSTCPHASGGSTAPSG
jgi:alpha-beta hydrolase superfamily lysophospholipase